MLALASDHAGFHFKEKIKKLLSDELGLEYKDFGTYSDSSCDYPDFAYAAAKAVGTGECEKGILVCGSGIGMDIVANKVENVRSALCMTVEMAELSRRHNDANVLSIGERLTDWETAEKMIRVWLSTPFEGGRHLRRVEKIHSLSSC
ncbi:MAG: ribose 5-phosphate isomerase B [Bacteroidetes bacterium]|jgi:ribose 5-phosphate isomerase B|nr:ribose 5-phosphate isomerase B [Bacteroidota bacterium]MCL5033861.1 ribose 5-phosphate isomerase B [Bacteroidota bacterium]